jgi:F0F1-type ATP synthase alpha subunit
MFAGVKGFLDSINKNDVPRFEKEFMGELKNKHSDLLFTIKQEGKLSDATEGRLRKILEQFVSTFATTK